MDLSVFFAGTSGSIPTVRRGLPALLVRRGGDRILFDCGEGTQRQLVRSVGLTDLDEIFMWVIHPFHAVRANGAHQLLCDEGLRPGDPGIE